MSPSEAPSGDNPGIITIRSPYPFADTVERLKAALQAKGIKIFANIDQQAEAAAVGLLMPPTVLILFGNPKAGTPLMIARPLSGLDLPLKALVSEAQPGEVLVSLNLGEYLFRISMAIYRSCLRQFEDSGLFGMDYSTFSSIWGWTLLCIVLAVPAWLVIRPPRTFRFRHLVLRAGAAIFFTEVVTCILYYGLALPLLILVIHNRSGIYCAPVFSFDQESFLFCITATTLIWSLIALAIRACVPEKAPIVKGAAPGIQ